MAEREIFSVCGKTVYMRRTKNGKPVIKKPTGKASYNDAKPRKAAPHTVISSNARNLFHSR